MPVYDIQFVDSIAAAPTVRLDLGGPGWTVLDRTKFGPPEMRRTVVTSPLVDGDQFPSSAYRSRTITLVVRVDGASDDAIAALVQRLMRELDRARNILRYRPGTSAPVFFRTWRTGPENFDWNPFTKEVTASIPAEPFAYGLRKTLSTVTVNNDPAAGTNACFFDVAGVEGDVDTPLYLSVDGTNLVTSTPDSSRQTAIAVRRRGTPSAAPFLLQAEAMSMGTDTTVQANSASFSGSGSNWTRTTFATATSMQDRLTIATWPSTPSVDVRGQYRVFMRYRSSILAPGVMQARLLWGTGNAYITNDTVTLIKGYGGAGGPYILYADLGIVQFPQGYDPVTDGPDGVELPVEGMSFALQAARVSGSASLDVDCLLFLPADDRLSLVTWPASPTLPVTLNLDSDRNQVYAEGTVGVLGRSGATLDGSAPMVSPGVTNRVWFVRDVGTKSSTGSGAQGDVLSATTPVTPYYWPRYLAVRPPTS